MSFSYQQGSNPPIDFPRMLIGDTVQFDQNQNQVYIFDDNEILSFEQIVLTPFQSGQFYSPNSGPLGGGTAGVGLPSPPIPYYRVAALMLNALASNQSRLAGVTKLLDVSLDIKGAAKALRDQAAVWLAMDDDSGAFVIIEQVNNEWSFAQRWWNQWQRQSAG